MVNFRTTDGSGSGAAATTLLGDGVVGIVTLTNAGGGFVSAPTVTFSEPKHVGAAATATLGISDGWCRRKCNFRHY